MIIDSRYSVIERLGVGASATVYKVEDIRTGKIYVLKKFNEIDTVNLYSKFSAEDMFMITCLEHPNLLNVINFGYFKKSIYYLGEFYEGETLSSFRLNPGNEDDFFDIIVQLCYGLNELHTRGIIHKDLKPENIVYRIEEDKVFVKILDYGITKVDLYESQQHISGTLPYIAPELFRGRKATPASDFYSLGVTLYKIATKTLPFTLEQISDMITGTGGTFLPKFPRELNPDIPARLEKLILKLLELNRRDRPTNALSIIEYVNRIQEKQYPFSAKFSLKNTIMHSAYLTRENYTHQLLDYLPHVLKSNGKVIVMSGEEGSGKDNILTLLRYHLLTEKYQLFDYKCTPQSKDPFFALIKEFLDALKRDKAIVEGLESASDQLRSFLSDSEELIEVGKKDLLSDYKFAKKFIETLAKQTPLIFIIRAGHYLVKETIDFINYISKTIKLHRILIVLEVDNPGSVSGLIHPVHINIDPLTFDEMEKYVNTLLRTEAPQDFLTNLYNNTNGNPSYIRDILIDLIDQKQMVNNHRKLIEKSEDQDFSTADGNHTLVFNFNIDWDNYLIPATVLHQIYAKLSHLKESTYRSLQILSVTYTPISSKLAKYILFDESSDTTKSKKSKDKTDEELFFLWNDALNNHIFTKSGEYYYFTFDQIKERLMNELGEQERIDISTKILNFYEGESVSKPLVFEGIIKNAELANDYHRIHQYSFKLAKIFSESGDREKAFELICKVIALDFSGKIAILQKDLLIDLAFFQETAELTGKVKSALDLFQSIPNFPEIYEKHFILGILNNASEKYPDGCIELKKALALAITGRQRINTLINLLWTSIKIGNFSAAKDYLDTLNKFKMDDELQVAFIDRKALYFNRIGKTKKAIQLLEGFISDIQPEKMIYFSARYCVNYGSLLNNLAIYYSSQKSYDDSLRCFEQAKNFWERINYKRYLGMLYNNIGDLELKQGKTKEALNCFEMALTACNEVEQARGTILTYLNFGEVYIKLGKFNEALKNLSFADKLMENSTDKSFQNSIIYNMAIASSKIKNLNQFYSFVKSHSPDVFEDNIDTITPLVKSYAFFLIETAQYDKASKLIVQNTKFDITKLQEQEFFYQVIGLIHLAHKEYTQAIEVFKTALTYAQKNNSLYAECIIATNLVECYIAEGSIEKAKEFYTKARKLASQHKYLYWSIYLNILGIDIELLDNETNYRIILRQILKIVKDTKKHEFYRLELRCYIIIVHIYNALNARKIANKYKSLLNRKLLDAVHGLPAQLKKNYINKINDFSDDYYQTRNISNLSKVSPKIDHWQEQLYELLKLDDVDRFKFLITKIISKIYQPDRFALILTDSHRNSLIKGFTPNKLHYNSDKDFDEFKKKNRFFINHNFSNEEFYSLDNQANISSSITENEIFGLQLDDDNYLYIPLRFKSIVVGCLVLADKGELPFTKPEMVNAKELRLHLTSLLTRINDISIINKSITQMKQLMEATNDLFAISEPERVEQEIISFCVDFVKCRRAFLIKKDTYGNFVYHYAIDSEKNILTDYPYISKTVLSQVYNSKTYLFTLNAMLDNTLKNSISVQDYHIYSVFCSPIIIDNEVHGLLYLDNYGAQKIDLDINIDLMDIFIMQAAVAIKNTLQYDKLMKKNQELLTLDKTKTEFINIVTHELNNPLMILQTHINKLKQNDFSNEKERDEVFYQTETALKRLIDKTNDIFTFTKLAMTSKLRKAEIDIRELIDNVVSGAEILAKKRKMVFNIEIKEALPSVEGNWETLHIMLYQIVLNAIRFTKDFGTIQVGVRKSTFPDEELDNKESLVIYVQDNGVGIPKKDQEDIFKPFHELVDIYSHHSGTIEFRSSGLGLGLSTAQRIARLHSGDIKIRSKENEGTTVLILLPFKQKDKIKN